MTGGSLHSIAPVTLGSRLDLSVDQAVELMQSLTEQVIQLHALGTIHAGLTLDAILLDASGRPVPEDIPSVRVFTRPMRDWVPAELRGMLPLELPTRIESAKTVLQTAHIDLDPREIDLYQLANLLCRLISGDSTDAYLRSPRVKGRVPQEWQLTLDEALGSDGHRRPATAVDFLRLIAKEPQFQIEPLPTDSEPGSSSTGSDTSPSIHGKNPDGDTGIRDGQNDRRTGRGTNDTLTRLGHYEVVGWIGHGGMGDVYRGYERALDRTVALKVLPTELSSEPEFVRRFYAEASAAARIVHPHVIQIYFIGEDAGRHFFAMQYVDGESLAMLLERRGRLSIQETLNLLEEVLSGLGAAHRQGLIHRDVKPGNILLDRVHQRALLADFGLVKSLMAMEGKTATGIVMGTVDYIAPEQGRGLPVDHRCDLYAIGVLAYQMLSGRLPFSADSPTALIFQHVYEPAPPLGDDVPAPLAAIVAKLMAKSRDRRHASAEAVLADLQAVRSGSALPSAADVELAANPHTFLQASPPQASAPFATTRLIHAPQFADEPWLLPDEQCPEPMSTWWTRLRDRWSNWLWSRTPEWVVQLQSTQQQVGGAVVEYERRRDQLRKLVNEATDVLTELRAALAQRPEDADLIKAAEDQEEQRGQMQLRLSQVEARLTQLCHQRDLLQARLKAAHAKLHFAGQKPSRIRRRRTLVAGGLLLLVVFGVLAVFRSPQQKGGAKVTVEATPDIPLPTEILKAARVTIDMHSNVHKLAFGSADGILGIVSADGNIELRDGKNGQLLKSIDSGVKDPRDVVIDQDGAQVINLSRAGNDYSLTIRDTRTDRESMVPTGLQGSVRLIGLTDSAEELLLAHVDRDHSELIRWSLKGNPAVRARSPVSLNDPVAFDCKASRLAINVAGEVILVDFGQGPSSPKARSIAASPTAVAIHPHDGTLILAGNDGIATVWDFAQMKPLRHFVGSSSPIKSLAVDDTGRWLAASDGEQVRIWDLGLLYVRAVIPVSNADRLAFSSDGKELAVVKDGRQIQIWNTDFPLLEVKFGSWLNRLPPLRHEEITEQYSAALQNYDPRKATTSDGRLIAAAPGDTIPFVKEAQSGKLLFQFDKAKPSLAITISPDDRLVVTGSFERNSGTGDLRLWDIRTGRQLGEFPGHIHYVHSVSFSNDGLRLISGGGEESSLLVGCENSKRDTAI